MKAAKQCSVSRKGGGDDIYQHRYKLLIMARRKRWRNDGGQQERIATARMTGVILRAGIPSSNRLLLFDYLFISSIIWQDGDGAYFQLSLNFDVLPHRARALARAKTCRALACAPGKPAIVQYIASNIALPHLPLFDLIYDMLSVLCWRLA